MPQSKKGRLIFLACAVAVLVALVGLILFLRSGSSEEASPAPSREANFYVSDDRSSGASVEKPSEKTLIEFLSSSFSVKSRDMPTDVIARAEEFGAVPGSSAATLPAVLLCESDCVQVNRVQVSDVVADPAGRLFSADVRVNVVTLGQLSFDCFVTASQSGANGTWGAMECFAFEQVNPFGSP